jgi:proteasome accessory factor B
VGQDLEKNSLRTFRLDRIVSEVSASKKSNTYVIPDEIPDQEADEVREIARIRIRKNRGHQLRSYATAVKSDEEWDEVSLPIFDANWLLRTILWHRDDVVVLEPSSLRKQIVQSLKELLVLHG